RYGNASRITGAPVPLASLMVLLGSVVDEPQRSPLIRAVPRRRRPPRHAARSPRAGPLLEGRATFSRNSVANRLFDQPPRSRSAATLIAPPARSIAAAAHAIAGSAIRPRATCSAIQSAATRSRRAALHAAP